MSIGQALIVAGILGLTFVSLVRLWWPVYEDWRIERLERQERERRRLQREIEMHRREHEKLDL